MSELIERTFGDGGKYFISPQLSICPNVGHGFFTRLGGVSKGIFESLNFRYTGGDNEKDIAENYKIAAEALGGKYDNIVRTCQKHTDTIGVVRELEGGFRQVGAPEGCDALITNVPGVVLAGFYADCQLILLYDEKHHAIGVVHAGWRGVANRILSKTIDKMSAEYGTQPKNIVAAVGPSICRRCFETDDDVKEMLFEIYEDQVPDYFYREGKKWHIDLKMLTYSSFIRLGVQPYNIDISNLCPCCGDKTEFWSHRRDGEQRGVHAGMITIKQ
ncbi:MAG: peptidoglycan editing factor PgeF [Clostridiaceae bacterium]|nr:peptidoglycan editing factor PgeF [Clostridiaceae bacterium]